MFTVYFFSLFFYWRTIYLQNFGVFCQTSTWISYQFSSVQSLSHVWLFVTRWIAARQASLSITNFWRLLKLMSTESVMPSSHLILCRPLLLLPSIFSSIRVFSNDSVLCISIEVSASASVLPMNFQDWFPLGWTGWISLQSKGLQSTGVSASASFLPKKSQGWSPSEWTSWISLQSKGLSIVFSNTTVQKHQFFGSQLSSQSNSHIHTWPLEKP